MENKLICFLAEMERFVVVVMCDRFAGQVRISGRQYLSQDVIQRSGKKHIKRAKVSRVYQSDRIVRWGGNVWR
jgi:hypothetical protein